MPIRADDQMCTTRVLHLLSVLDWDAPLCTEMQRWATKCNVVRHHAPGLPNAALWPTRTRPVNACGRSLSPDGKSSGPAATSRAAPVSSAAPLAQPLFRRQRAARTSRSRMVSSTVASVSMRLLSSISPATTGASLHPLAPSAGQSIRGRHSRSLGTTSLLLRPAQVDTGGTPIDTGGMAFARLFPVHFRSVYHSRLRF